MKLENKKIVAKVLNNNILLVNSDDSEQVIFAKGIGFGKKIGSILEEGTEVEKIFKIFEEENKRNFRSIIDRVESDFFGVCEESICEISKFTNEELNENIHIGLIDHLNFAVKRLKNNEEIENPFLVEIETLYKKEFELATMVAKKVGNYADVRIPDGEIGFIALHIHTALNNGKISNTLKNSYLSNSIVEYVEDALGIDIDRRSIDYARFLTHIKFAIQRIEQKRKVLNDLSSIIKITYKRSYRIAEQVGKILSTELGVEVDDDEIAYLTIHIERFTHTLS